jgi:hypothetical protein
MQTSIHHVVAAQLNRRQFSATDERGSFCCTELVVTDAKGHTLTVMLYSDGVQPLVIADTGAVQVFAEEVPA